MEIPSENNPENSQNWNKNLNPLFVINVFVCFFSVFFALVLFEGSVWAAQKIHLTDDEIRFIKNHPWVNVHNEADWPPFNFRANGKPQGVSIDIMNRIAELTGLRVKYVKGSSWNEFIRMLHGGELDVMLNIVQTSVRRESFLFTTPYCKSLGGVYVRKGDARKYGSLNDFAGKTLAFCEGCATERILRAYYPEIRLLPVRDTLKCLEAVNSGKADAFTQEIGATDYLLSQRMATNVVLGFQVADKAFRSDLSIAVASKNRVLFNIIQKGMDGISEKEKHSIRRKWFLEARSHPKRKLVGLTSEEQEFLAKNKTVRVCVNAATEPMVLVGNEWRPGGISFDFISEIGHRLGVNVQQVPVETLEESLKNAKNGMCDIIPFISETETNGEALNFTKPYFDFPTVIVARNDSGYIYEYHGLGGRKVSLTEDFFLVDFINENHPDVEIIFAANRLEALQMVSKGTAFATLIGLPSAINGLRSIDLKNLKISGLVPQKSHARLGVVKGKETLFRIFDKGINSLTEEEKEALFNKRFKVSIHGSLDKIALAQILIVILGITTFLLWRQRILSCHNLELQRLNCELNKLSVTDHLTGLYNRFYTDKFFRQEVERIKRYQGCFSAVLLDIDFFKKINDRLGHVTGDQVLKKISNILRENARSADIVCRWGGEEFILLLPETNISKAEIFANKIRKIISKTDFEIDQEVTASFGVCQYSGPESLDQFLSRIDYSLYQSKKSGRNNVTAGPVENLVPHEANSGF